MAQRHRIPILHMLLVMAMPCVVTSIGKASTHATVPNDVKSEYNEEDRNGIIEDQQFREYEDSLMSVLYPRPTFKDLENYPQKDVNTDSDTVAPSGIAANKHVPDLIKIDTSLEVGEIEFSTFVDAQGAKTYSIPVKTYPGVNGMQPEISLEYNSHCGNSIMGTGWHLSGVPLISRISKTIYYDNCTDGINFDKDDAFMLDGERLVAIEKSSDFIIYQTQFSKIKAKAYFSGSLLKYFEVFFPDGRKGTFGYATTTSNRLSYPITSMCDRFGNTINYTYQYIYGKYRLSRITYNSTQLSFRYASRESSLIQFNSGIDIREQSLLSAIEVSFNGTILHTYGMTYEKQGDFYLMNEVSFNAGGKYVNPLKLYYGTGNDSRSFLKKRSSLYYWYDTSNNSAINITRGKFDYLTGLDGFVCYPASNPYWHHHRHYGTGALSEDRYENLYDEESTLLIYSSLEEDIATCNNSFKLGKGFVDLICADIDGSQEDRIIKIRNFENNGLDRVEFEVFGSNLYANIGKLFDTSFDFNTLHTDGYAGRSVHPKFFFPGDFNGDGKIEILGISADNPFETGKNPSTCVLYDIKGRKKLYDGSFLSYKVDFVGTSQSNPQDASNQSDRIIILDYDGDGKSDIVHIHDAGTDVYSMMNGNTVSPHKIATFTNMRKSTYKDKMILCGEFNGDGLVDILMSPVLHDGDTWTLFSSKGDGTFHSSTFAGPEFTDYNNNGFITQDINLDGRTDLVKYDKQRFDVYIFNSNKIEAVTATQTYDAENALLIPVDINSHNTFNQLLSVNGNKIVKYGFSRCDDSEILLTGMADSYGVIHKNYYRRLSDMMSDGVYTSGKSSTFPYVDLHGNITVLEAEEKYVDGKVYDKNSFCYKEAVYHRQGLGFMGFKSIVRTDKKSMQTIQKFDTSNFGLLLEETHPAYTLKKNYESITKGKTITINLISKEETDKLTGIVKATSYSYDEHGFPLTENCTFSDGIRINKTFSYHHENNISTGYHLGFLTDLQTVNIRNYGKYGVFQTVERQSVSEFSNCQPLTVINYYNGNQTNKSTMEYDGHGNMLSQTDIPFSATAGTTSSQTYDAYGRTSTITDEYGWTTAFSFDAKGRISSKKDGFGTTTLTYDNLGRVNGITNPDNTKKTIRYTFFNNGIAINETESGSPGSQTVYDVLGREVRTSVTAFNGTSRYTDKYYDANDNLIKETQGNAGYKSISTSYTYDDYNRLVTVNDDSSKTTTHSYQGSKVTTIENGISTERTYDSQGWLVASSNTAGAIQYVLQADGKPYRILLPYNQEVAFSYDKFGRRILMKDPTSGDVACTYDAFGNISRETDASGGTVSKTYDEHGNVTRIVTDEFVANKRYNNRGQLLTSFSDDGYACDYAYDGFGRLAMETERKNDRCLTKTYTYLDGNINVVSYSTNTGFKAREEYRYKNGVLSEIVLNDSISIHRLVKENGLGQPTEICSGPVTKRYQFSDSGLPSARSALVGNKYVQKLTYSFDEQTGNLISRTDAVNAQTERLYYDQLNRLVASNSTAQGYDNLGNIVYKTDAGNISFGDKSNPYLLTDISNVKDDCISTESQEITYTSFGMPDAISEYPYYLSISYNPDFKRVAQTIKRIRPATYSTKYYLGDCYEAIIGMIGNVTEYLYLGGGYYKAPAVLVNNGGEISLHYLERDYLGSITHVLSNKGMVEEELSYDPWGRLREPSTLRPYPYDEQNARLFSRGFTGHEHLTWCGLINMNGRLYDPVVARFLSPDPYIQFIDDLQSFNPYSYALNNPFKYTDESGEFLSAILIGAAIGGIINLAMHWDDVKSLKGWSAFGKGLMYFGVGALAGGASMAAGAGTAALMGIPTSVTVTGILPGMAVGAASGAANGFILNTGNALVQGKNIKQSLEAGIRGTLQDAVVGTVTGGIGGGCMAWKYGDDAWLGVTIRGSTRQYTGYYGFDRDTRKIKYVGITGRDPDIRFAEHLNSNTNRAQLYYKPQK